MRVLAGGEDWAAEARTDDGRPVVLRPGSVEGGRLEPLGPAARPRAGRARAYAPGLEDRAALRDRFADPDAPDVAPLDDLVPTDAPRRAPEWPDGGAEALRVEPRADGRWDVVAGNGSYELARREGLRAVPVVRSRTAGPAPDASDPATAEALEDLGRRTDDPELEALKARHPDVDLHVYTRGDWGIVVSMMRVDPAKRREGLAGAAMRDIVELADRRGLVVGLTPADNRLDSFAMSKPQLRRWYGRLGFRPNKGRKVDFRFNEAMVRDPQGGPQRPREGRESPEAAAAVAERLEARRGFLDTLRTYGLEPNDADRGTIDGLALGRAARGGRRGRARDPEGGPRQGAEDGRQRLQPRLPDRDAIGGARGDRRPRAGRRRPLRQGGPGDPGLLSQFEFDDSGPGPSGRGSISARRPGRTRPTMGAYAEATGIKEEDDEYAGHLDYRVAGGRVWLGNATVRPDDRRRGVATALLDELHRRTGKPLVHGDFMSPGGIQLAFEGAARYPDRQLVWLGGDRPFHEFAAGEPGEPEFWDPASGPPGLEVADVQAPP